MNRLVRRQRAALALFIALTVSGVGVAMAAPQSGDQPTVTLDVLTQDGQALAESQSITVAGAGFPANSSGLIVQSAVRPNGTTALSNQLGTFTAGSDGRWTQTVTVTRTFTEAGSGETIDCNAAGVVCSVEAFTTSGNANTRHTISFASSGTTAPPTTAPPTTAPPTTAPPTTAPPTTAPPTTAPPTTAPPTTAPPTTAGPTTSIVVPTTTPGGTQCDLIRAARARVNAQIDAARAAIIASLPPAQQAAPLAQLEAIRAQANAQLDALLVGCPAA